MSDLVSFHTPHTSNTHVLSLYDVSCFQRSLKSFHIPHTDPWLQIISLSHPILPSPGPQSVTPFKVEIQRKVSSLSVADVWGAVKDLSTMFTFIRLLSSGARYLVEMVVCHGGNQNFHCAPHKVESSLRYIYPTTCRGWFYIFTYLN